VSQEKAVIKKPAGDLARESSPDTKIYEVIVKFHRDGRPVIEAFLLTNMISVTIAQTANSEVLLAYCQFEGDIKTLDEKLASLRQSAMVVLGEKEDKFLDFFVALRGLSISLPQLLSPNPTSNFPRFLKPEWMTALLAAFGLFALWQGYQFVSGIISRAVNPPPASFSAPVATYSQWSPYLLPEYHQTWLDLKKKHQLSDEMMLSLFRTIKVIDKYGAGHHLRDLTIYPGPIDRALSLMILKDVGSAEDLQTLLKTLDGYAAQWKSLPDNPGGKARFWFDGNDDHIVLTFYEHILGKSRREFTDKLISELRRSHLSG
jgi:hypothetical protein